MTTVFRTTRRVEFADTDMAGLVHFANFFRFMEAAEVEFLRSRGFSVAMRWEGQEIGFPRVSVACDYLRPARFEDVLDITVTLRTIGRKSLTYGFEFSRGQDILARGQITCVCCRITDERTIASIEIPDSVRKGLE